jgi:hypothetical protein
MLNSKQEEVMAIAQEECAEVIQAVSKIFRFGIDASHEGVTNREHLTIEAGDLRCMLDLMVEFGLIDATEMINASFRKRKKLETWSKIFNND